MDYHLQVGKLDLELEQRKISGHGMCPNAIVLELTHEQAVALAHVLLNEVVRTNDDVLNVSVAGLLRMSGAGFRRLGVGDHNYDPKKPQPQYP